MLAKLISERLSGTIRYNSCMIKLGNCLICVTKPMPDFIIDEVQKHECNKIISNLKKNLTGHNGSCRQLQKCQITLSKILLFLTSCYNLNYSCIN